MLISDILISENHTTSYDILVMECAKDPVRDFEKQIGLKARNGVP